MKFYLGAKNVDLSFDIKNGSFYKCYHWDPIVDFQSKNHPCIWTKFRVLLVSKT